MTEHETKASILAQTRQYHDQFHKVKKLRLGKDYINYSGVVSNHQEMTNLVDCALRKWYTLGHYADKFSKAISNKLDVKHCILTNSGSSANLLAVTALTSPRLLYNRLQPGDEIITTACSFPTTIAPIVQNNLVPVFVDIDLQTFNIDIDQIEKAITNRTKAMFITHMFGNPVDMDKIMEIAKKHKLWVIEDNCDSLGAMWRNKHTGTIGDIGTLSFYPAHHITTGEGGAVLTNNDYLKKIIQSYRDWGRDCWCKPGDISQCDRRFQFVFDGMPADYDHKYIFTHIGYNLKMDDLNAAIGLAQIDKLDTFIDKRNRNFNFLMETFQRLSGNGMVLPKWSENATPSWFCFPFTYHRRKELVQFLENSKIQTRLVFAGNILRQPAFRNINYRITDELRNTNTAMYESMFLGVYPGLTLPTMKYIGKMLKEFFHA